MIGIQQQSVVSLSASAADDCSLASKHQTAALLHYCITSSSVTLAYRGAREPHKRARIQRLICRELLLQPSHVELALLHIA